MHKKILDGMSGKIMITILCYDGELRPSQKVACACAVVQQVCDHEYIPT